MLVLQAWILAKFSRGPIGCVLAFFQDVYGWPFTRGLCSFLPQSDVADPDAVTSTLDQSERLTSQPILPIKAALGSREHIQQLQSGIQELQVVLAQFVHRTKLDHAKYALLFTSSHHGCVAFFPRL